VKYKPEEDGITHINIYSKAKTELGRFLSNFAYIPETIMTEDGPFVSIEGYWYWLSCKDDELRSLHGWTAKAYGREFGGSDWCDTEEFKRKICAAITTKILDQPRMLEEFTQSTLPFVHYYQYCSKVVEPKDGKWIWEHIESLRKMLKKNET
jgi:hypothetical protein